MSKPVVAIVGRPNVGKSTLFNKLVGARLSIVDDTPGVTRDRIYGDCEWGNRTLLLVDTGGIEPYSDDIILKQMRRQAQLAIDSADVIILVTDVRSGVVSTDSEVASMLQKSGKPIVLCVNKCDTVGEPPAEYYEFYNLGLGDPIAVSSVHGMGTGDLLDAVCEHLPPADEEEEEDDTIKVAVIGKPNVGKSSLVNAILGEDRMIVSDIAGTTRDATDSYVENEYGKFVFIDTAGLRRKSRVYDAIEKYSVIRARMAVERAQVCVIMIDAVEGFTEQDSKVAGYAHDQGKACIIVVNKWDAVEKETGTLEQFRKEVLDALKFMDYAPVLFLSAKTGQRVHTVIDMVDQVARFSEVGSKYGSVAELTSTMADGEENSGIRLVKSPQPNLADKQLRWNPDCPVIRLSEIYYMLAECELRAGHKKEAAELINQVRARNFENRNDPDPVTADNLDEYRMLDEWMIEFLGEGRRRTDLIRWGAFTSESWWDHTPSNDKNMNRFPIPNSAISANNLIKQNPGYGGTAEE